MHITYDLITGFSCRVAPQCYNCRFLYSSSKYNRLQVLQQASWTVKNHNWFTMYESEPPQHALTCCKTFAIWGLWYMSCGSICKQLILYLGWPHAYYQHDIMFWGHSALPKGFQGQLICNSNITSFPKSTLFIYSQAHSTVLIVHSSS